MPDSVCGCCCRWTITGDLPLGEVLPDVHRYHLPHLLLRGDPEQTAHHPIQYLLVGFAICLFYVLLLSISEHLNFGKVVPDRLPGDPGPDHVLRLAHLPQPEDDAGLFRIAGAAVRLLLFVVNWKTTRCCWAVSASS